jgi:hypothetical protein
MRALAITGRRIFGAGALIGHHGIVVALAVLANGADIFEIGDAAADSGIVIAGGHVAGGEADGGDGQYGGPAGPGLQRLGNFGHGINLLIKSSTRYGGAREVFYDRGEI